MLEIVNVLPGSAAARLGIERGDVLVSINGHGINDVIDYQFHIADERLSIALRKKGSTGKNLIITKDPDDTLGVECAPLIIRRCRNRCIFCFVDQMPAGCRKSLYVKDDDYRASFLYGNYITLGNLNEEDWQRIFSQKLSPLYISVHATDPSLRSSILRNKKAPDIMEQLKRLARGGIRMHTQIVLSPGVNDGRQLVKSVEDIAGLFPAVSSIAVVPVGLTAHRKGAFPLTAFTRRQAVAVVDAVESMGRRWKRTFGARMVFASDEFYIKAGRQFPPVSFYEDFPQIENGVGMVAEFLHDAFRTRLPKRVPPQRMSLVSGASFSPVLRTVLKRLEKVEGISIRLITAKNLFFGSSVTVAGLLTGSDILNAVRGKRLGSMLLVPANAIKEDEDIFLDGMSRPQLEKDLGIPVQSAGNLSDMVRVLAKWKKQGGTSP